MDYNIIIIGAGISGLAAARYLQKHGIEDFIILEAKGKAGGRIDTRHFNLKVNSAPIELGAQWIHGQDNDFYRFLEKCGQVHPEASWEGEGEFSTRNGQVINADLVRRIINWVGDSLNEIEEEISILDFKGPQDAYKSVGVHLRDKFDAWKSSIDVKGDDIPLYDGIFQWTMSFQRIDNACNFMSDLSLFRWGEFKNSSGRDYNNFLKGGQAFVDKFMTSPLKDKILLNSPVSCIDWGDLECAKVLTDSGREFKAKGVLITCSIGVLKATKNSLFNPPLPPKISKAIDSIGYGPLTKIYLEWQDCLWGQPEFRGIQLLWPGEYIECCVNMNKGPSIKDLEDNWHKAITGFDPILGNPNALLAWMGGPEAEYVETLNEDKIGLKCSEILESFTRLTIPPPKSVIVSKWSSDPFFRGAYSHRTPLSDQIPGDVTECLAEPISSHGPVLLLAGEAIHKSHYSTLSGAFESGEAQARRLIKLLGFDKCKLSNSNGILKELDKLQISQVS